MLDYLLILAFIQIPIIVELGLSRWSRIFAAVLPHVVLAVFVEILILQLLRSFIESNKKPVSESTKSCLTRDCSGHSIYLVTTGLAFFFLNVYFKRQHLGIDIYHYILLALMILSFSYLAESSQQARLHKGFDWKIRNKQKRQK